MEVLDTAIAAVILPHIAGSLSASTDEATWVLTSYLVANAVVLPASSWFSLKFGRRNFLLFCISLFTVASFACGAAQSLGMILIARTLGGWLTDQYSWRWAFYINIPIGVVATFMIMRFVKDPPYIQSAKPGKMDGIGLGLLAVWIRWAAAVVVIALVAFLIRELVIQSPIVNLKIFKDRNFAISCILIGAVGAVLYGMITLLPLFYQTLLNYTAWAAGLAVSPRGIGAILIMPIVGVLTAKVDNRYLIASGFAIFGWCAWWISNVTLQISQWSLLWPIIISGVGTGLMFVPLSTTAVGTLSNEQMGNASGLFNLLRNIGGSIGISVVDTMVARRQQVHRAELSRYIAPTAQVQQTLLRLQTYMSLHAGPRLAKLRAYALLENGLNQQSVLYAYVDDFRYMVLVCVLCLPIVFLLRPVKAKRGATPAGH